jgi:N utilization substance protein B
VKTRSRARGWALQVLYAREARGESESLTAILDDFIAHRRIRPASLDYLRRLVTTLDAHTEKIDRSLDASLHNWKLNRLSAIDRNVLRVGAAELLFHPDVPARAAIQEAILLAEKYGTAESPRFVNGVLDGIMRSAGTGPGEPH